MKSDFAMLVFSILSLVLCAAMEDMLPKIMGLGIPLLLSVALVFSDRALASWSQSIFCAIAAGSMEDAISALPVATSASFFAIAVFSRRKFHIPFQFCAAVYPLYFCWLWMWGLVGGGENLLRALVSAPIGILTFFVLRHLVGFFAQRAGLK
jgi:hypothetical protein